jgi:formate hydrogenlyase transcriptional activator
MLSPGPVLQVPLTECTARVTSAPPTPHDTLEAVESKDIRAVLGETGWVLGGLHGAAVRLGLKRSTLQFRLGKLGSPAPVHDDALPSRAGLPRTPDPVAVDGFIGINSCLY